MLEVDWTHLEQMPTEALKKALFGVLQDAARNVQLAVSEDVALFELVPRIASLLERRDDLSDFVEPLSALARSVGLWNYIPVKESDPREQILAESMSLSGEMHDITLHREQARALSTILNGENLILSAPTSFGKSLLIDAAIASNRFARIAVIVPTIALLDETRRRLTRRFGREYDVLVHPSETQRQNGVIFVGTQERIINRTDIGSLDILIVDEFYKLDSRKDYGRSNILNAAVYSLLKKAKQFFFLGPNISDILGSDLNRWKFKFLGTSMTTVAVDSFDFSDSEDKLQALKNEIFRWENWPALVFTSSPEKANDLAEKLWNEGPVVGSGSDMASWLADNFGARWELSQSVAKGIGIHHGRIPRAVAAKFVQMFNEKQLPILICTSTLIEGINTAAKSIFIYDDSINNRKYDFFTFSNIKGRAGRLGEHHVGKIFLFNKRPLEVETEVSSHIFDDYGDAPDDFIVHLEDDDLTGNLRDRIDFIARRLNLTPSELKKFSSLGIERLQKIKRQVELSVRKREPLEWSGWPNWHNLVACCEIICAVYPPRHMGARSARQLALYLHRLRMSYKIENFFERYSETYRGSVVHMDQIFRFLRACEYTLPEYFAAIELFLKKAGFEPNYALALRDLPRWFRPDPVKSLEERGIPMQISERLYKHNDSVGALGNRLLLGAQSPKSALTAFEREWILGLVLR